MFETATVRPFNRSHDSFLQRLKKETASQHTALEAQPLLQVLMQPSVSRQQYCDYLLRMKKITETYESRLWPLLSSSLPAFVPKRSSSLLIAEDLRQLACSDQQISLPEFRLPSHIHLPFAWGFAYVMEGAKLGGLVIFKHLQKVLGITSESGGSYLTNKDANTGLEWKEFLQTLSLYTSTNNGEEAVLNGAIFGFTSIHEYFDANEKAHAD